MPAVDPPVQGMGVGCAVSVGSSNTPTHYCISDIYWTRHAHRMDYRAAVGPGLFIVVLIDLVGILRGRAVRSSDAERRTPAEAAQRRGATVIDKPGPQSRSTELIANSWTSTT